MTEPADILGKGFLRHTNPSPQPSANSVVMAQFAFAGQPVEVVGRVSQSPERLELSRGLDLHRLSVPLLHESTALRAVGEGENYTERV